MKLYPHLKLSGPLRRSRALARGGLSVLRHQGALTLIELLVVMAIIGILASVSLPALRGLGRGNAMNAAIRQVSDDLALARMKAISSRSSVYVVFVPTNVVWRMQMQNEANPAVRLHLTNLITAPYSSYAILTRRTVGDQPGRHTPRYVTEWKQLPGGVLIAPYKYDGSLTNHVNEYRRAFQTGTSHIEGNVRIPFPTSTNYTAYHFHLPYIAFNSSGQLMSGHDEIIPLAQGSVFFTGTSGPLMAPDVEVQPPNNYTNNVIRVNWLTGRTLVERTEPL